MYTRTRTPKPPKPVIKMDPDCAICRAPAQAACDCEAKGLDMAIKQAEDRIMRSIYTEIRSWVRGHAQDYILEYFRQLADKRKTAHSEHLDRITSQAYYQYNMRPHPQQIQDAEESLKRGIDEDWKASVQRYPEVLSYFFNLVELSIPSDDDPQVRDPALGGPNGHKKAPRRTHGDRGGHGPPNAPPAIAHTSYANMIGGMPPKTPPPMDRHERRGQAHRDKRSARHSMPAQHAPYQQYHHAPYM